MQHRSGDLEDLPALALRPLRELTLREAPAGREARHIAAASGVVRRGDFLYVIGDDLLSLGEFRLSDPGPGVLRRVLDEEGADKADLEALTVLPPFEDHPFGALFGLGSGSRPGRDRGFFWPLDADGSLRGEPRPIDLAPLYGMLGRQVPQLNVEGVCVMGDRLWLLHRGDHGKATNVVAELSLDAVMASLRSDLRVDVAELEAISSYDLGQLDGVELTFSDATPLGGDLLVFTASAEDPDPGAGDEPIRGSVIGTIDPGGVVHRLRTIDRRFKVEGVHATIDTGVVDVLLVCDQDDPDRPAPLLSAAMPLDGALERGPRADGAGSGPRAAREPHGGGAP